MTADAFLKATEDALNVGRDKLVSIPTRELAKLAAAFAGNFTTRLVIVCLTALVSSEDKTSLLVKMTEKLVRNPLRTGVDILKIAMKLEPAENSEETQGQSSHRVERYRDALRCFDSALQNAEEIEKPSIHFFRGLTTMRIPGAEREAVLHFGIFSQACEEAALILSEQAEREDKAAQRDQSVAEQIQVPKVTGLGGGSFSASSISEAAMERAGLISSAQKHRTRCHGLASKATELRLAAKTVQLLVSGTNGIPAESDADEPKAF